MNSDIVKIDVRNRDDDVYASLSFSYLIIDLLNTPVANSRVANIVIIDDHVLYRLATPYSDVVRILVKIGVDIKAIPFVTTLEKTNHKDAFAGRVNCVYLLISFDFIVCHSTSHILLVRYIRFEFNYTFMPLTSVCNRRKSHVIPI